MSTQRRKVLNKFLENESVKETCLVRWEVVPSARRGNTKRPITE